jgi:hypothetical protein
MAFLMDVPCETIVAARGSRSSAPSAARRILPPSPWWSAVYPAALLLDKGEMRSRGLISLRKRFGKG